MEFANIFLAECPKMLTKIREAIERNDGKGLEHAAHNFKGSVGMLTAKTPYEASLRLETMGRNGDMTGTEEVLATLEV